MKRKILFIIIGIILIAIITIILIIRHQNNSPYQKNGICLKEYSKYWNIGTKGTVYIYTQLSSTTHYNNPNSCTKNNIPNADIFSFKIIEYPYSKDKNNVYYYNHKIDSANPKTFQIIKEILSKDDTNVYVATKKIVNADPETIEIIDDFNKSRVSYAKDKNYVYYFIQSGRNEIINEADPKTFKFVNYTYAKDKNNIYCRQHSVGKINKLDGADFDTFQVLTNSSGKDKNYFYDDCDIKK